MRLLRYLAQTGNDIFWGIVVLAVCMVLLMVGCFVLGDQCGWEHCL